MITWTELEQAVADRIKAKVTAFKYVAAVAHAGLATPTGWPAAIVWRPESIVITREPDSAFIAGTIRTLWRARIEVIIATKAGTSQGESRLATGGLYDLESQVRTALVGFTPNVNGTLGIWPFLNSRSSIENLEAGAVSGISEFTIEMSETT